MNLKPKPKLGPSLMTKEVEGPLGYPSSNGNIQQLMATSNMSALNLAMVSLRTQAEVQGFQDGVH